jgi:type IV pilus assembly protein PilV
MTHSTLPTIGSRRLQAGVGLIEVLVAVLILALGLLGMAGLQANALKTNQSAYARSQAVMLSYYMLDAMRADRLAAISQQYNTGAAGGGGVIEPACSAAVFNAPTLLDNNRADWLTSLKTTLGDADTTCGAIFCGAGAANECIIQITWDDSRAGGMGQQRIETRSRL